MTPKTNGSTLRIGFLPLVDAALPILALELGFAEAEGLSLELAPAHAARPTRSA